MENPSENQRPVQPLGYPRQPRVGLAPHQQHQVDMLWQHHNQEVAHMVDFKCRQLPVTRIKRVMKAEPEVKMVSSEAPIVIAKACEMFIQDLTLRAWLNAVENNACTIETINLYDAIRLFNTYKFLLVTNSNRRGENNSSEVTQSRYSSVGDTNPHVAMTGTEQLFEGNLGMYLNEEPPEQLWIQLPAQGTIKNPHNVG